MALETMFPKAAITALGDGLEFMKIFNGRMDGEWELVVLDVMLPNLSGVEICQQIRGARGGERVPVLAMSGYDTPEMEQKMKRAGATRYLPKPFEIMDFRKVILEILG